MMYSNDNDILYIKELEELKRKCKIFASCKNIGKNEKNAYLRLIKASDIVIKNILKGNK